jgi:hypothetical protein
MSVVILNLTLQFVPDPTTGSDPAIATASSKAVV